MGAVLTINLCISVILRKQWMEHERLAFPIASALLELTGVSGTRGMMVAYMAGTAIGVIIDQIWFPGNGHMIHVAW